MATDQQTATSPAPSILLLGATGKLGVEIIRHAAAQKLQVHAFARFPPKLSAADTERCVSVFSGNARDSASISAALTQTKASIVIMSIGSGNDLSRTDIREKSAHALVDVLNQDQFAHVKVVVVSAVGAGGTRIEIGFGMGRMLELLLRNPMHDHNRQEEVMKEIMGRVLIVRPVSLGKGKGGREVVELEGKPKRGKIDRFDLAKWIVERVQKGDLSGQVNLESV